MKLSKLKWLAGVVGLAIVLLVVSIGLLVKPVSAPTTTASPAEAVVPPSPTPAASVPATVAVPTVQAQADDVVAVINGQPISGADWETAVRLDAAMSQLAGQPIPQPEDTLDRLINESLVLQSGPQARAFSPAEAEARLQTLMQGWAVSEADLTATLTAADLTRDNVLTRIQTLLTVEDALQQMAQKGIDMAAWLPQARAQSDVGLYQSAPFQPQPAPDAVAAATPTHAASMAAAVAPPPDLPVAPYPDSVAPDFSAETLAGEQMTLSQWRGKPTLINFWASWCGPCREELPALQDAYNRYQGDINFVAVNVREGKGTIRSFANKNAITFPIALDPAGEISTGLYQVRGIPTTFFLDSRGVIVKRHVGPLDLQAIDSYLLPLLNPPTDSVAVETQPSPSETPAPDTATQAANLAPDFELPDAQGTSFKLSDALSDGPVVLVFYRGVT